MAYELQQGNTTEPLRFLLVLNSDHITGATGMTPTVTIAKNDGLGFVTPSGAVSELGNGWYQVAANATDASSIGPLTLHAAASGCDPADEEYVVVNYNPTTISGTVTANTTQVSAGDLITAALRRINVLQAGETPAAEDSSDALLRLNALVDYLALEPLTIYSVARTTWTITSTQGVIGTPYTVGTSGDIAIPRPVSMQAIDRVCYQNTAVSPTLELPLTPLTQDAWSLIPQKDLTSPLPGNWYYEPTYPTGSLYLWLVPTQSDLQGVIYAKTLISQFGALTDVVSLPPGYQRMLRDNLALELWPEFRENVPVDPLLVQAATESKRAIKLANVRMLDMSVDTAVVPRRSGRYNIYSDN